MATWFPRWLTRRPRRATAPKAPRIRVEPLEARDVPATSVFSFSAPTYSVGEGGGLVTITVTRTITGTGSNPTKVSYAIADGTATAGSDYTAVTGNVNFGNNQTSKTFTVPILEDNLVEGDETFSVSLAPVNAGDSVDPTLGSATVTIVDNDTTAVSISDVSHAEGQSGTTAFDFTVTLSNPSTVPVTVDYATADGTATLADNDFLAAAGTLTFAPGELTKTVTVTVPADHTPEADETFAVNLSNAVNAGIADAQGVGTILNDDTAPVATADAYSVNEDTTLTVAAAQGVLANDTDAQNYPLSAALVTGPTDGSLTFNTDGSFTYTPAADYNGTDSFTYKTNDGFLDSAETTVTITVTPVNDAPVAAGQSVSTNEDTQLTGTATATDVDGDTLTYSVVDGPAHGTVALGTDGSFTYTPDANYNGADSFTFKANDGTVDSNVATVTITVTPVNDDPVTTDQSLATNEDTALTGAVTATDVDGDTLTYSVVGGPTHGDLTFNPDGSFTYTPAADFNGSDSFTFKASDGQADSNVATVGITIDPVNDAPVTTDQSLTTNEDTAATGTLVATDIDGPALTYVLVDTANAHGTVTLTDAATGAFEYTPDANYNGTASFTFQANDGALDSNVATVTITVTPVNDAPVAAGQSVSTNEDTLLTGAVTATDVDGDTLSYSVVDGPAHGSVVFNADGSYTYTPGANYNGADSFTFKANDGQADSNVATVAITVNPVNDPPVAGNDTAGMVEDSGSVTVNVLTNDTPGPDAGDTLTITQVTQGAHGTVTIVNGQSVTYTPAANFNGTDSFQYTVTDSQGATVSATVTVTVANDFADHLEVGTSAGTTTFTEGKGPVVVDPGVLVGSAGGMITRATVQITGGYVRGQDFLQFRAQHGIYGTFNPKTGTLTLSGKASPAAYEAALRSIKYRNPSVAPVEGVRTISFQVADKAGTGAPTTRGVQVVGVNSAPRVNIGAYTRTNRVGGTPVVLTPYLGLRDIDNATLTGARVRITSGLAAGDVLTFTARAGITGTYDAGTGVLTLTGTASVLDYRTVLRSVRFAGSVAGARTAAIAATDGLDWSNEVLRPIQVVA
jgi:VCBS repeat-containing protein